MEILMQIFNNISGLIVGGLVFFYLMHQIETADPESGLHLYSKNDGLLFLSQFAVSSVLVNYRFSSVVDRIFFLAMFSIMIIHSYTDSKTKTVYRPFNYCLWIIGVIYVIIKFFVTKNPPAFDGGWKYTVFYIIILIIIMSVSVFLLHASGKGDGYILIGLSLFVPFSADGTLFISLVITLLYYICAGFLQIFSNLKKIEIKKLRFKEKLPFAPALLYGLWIIILLTAFFATPAFQSWQLTHLF